MPSSVERRCSKGIDAVVRSVRQSRAGRGTRARKESPHTTDKPSGFRLDGGAIPKFTKPASRKVRGLSHSPGPKQFGEGQLLRPGAALFVRCANAAREAHRGVHAVRAPRSSDRHPSAPSPLEVERAPRAVLEPVTGRGRSPRPRSREVYEINQSDSKDSKWGAEVSAKAPDASADRRRRRRERLPTEL